MINYWNTQTILVLLRILNVKRNNLFNNISLFFYFLNNYFFNMQFWIRLLIINSIIKSKIQNYMLKKYSFNLFFILHHLFYLNARNSFKFILFHTHKFQLDRVIYKNILKFSTFILYSTTKIFKLLINGENLNFIYLIKFNI